MPDDPTVLLLLYFVMPLWLVAGFADWLCHRRTDIAHTAGVKESLLHLLMYAEIALPLLACLLLDINALVFALMIAAFLAHEATALWDVAYASKHRRIAPVEQHIHSFLELLPLIAGLLVAQKHWPQLLALFGLGLEPARWNLELKHEPLPWPYIVTVLAAALLLDLLPYLEELRRCLRARRDARQSA